MYEQGLQPKTVEVGGAPFEIRRGPTQDLNGVPVKFRGGPRRGFGPASHALPEHLQRHVADPAETSLATPDQNHEQARVAMDAVHAIAMQASSEQTVEQRAS